MKSWALKRLAANRSALPPIWARPRSQAISSIWKRARSWAPAGIMNPQIGYGEDVISRMVHATRNDDGSSELARVVREGLNNLIVALAFQAGVSRNRSSKPASWATRR